MTDPVAMQSPSCPRCGYDLRGSVASWTRDGETASCPLDGICSECGYTFLWRDLLNPQYQRLPGFFEHARTRRERIAWGFRTTRWLILPWVFWEKVKLHHQRRPWRAVMLGMWIVAFALLVRFSAAAIALLVLQLNPAKGVAHSSSAWLVNSVLGPHVTWWPSSFGFAGGANLITIGDPAGFLAPPLGLLAFAFAWAACVVWVLPHTRRQAKLRPAHAWRSTLYVFFPMAIGALMNGVLVAAQLWAEALMVYGMSPTAALYNGVATDLIRATIAGAQVVWLAAFWWSAVLRAWKLRHGVATCLLLTTAAGLFALVVGYGCFALVVPLGAQWNVKF